MHRVSANRACLSILPGDAKIDKTNGSRQIDAANNHGGVSASQPIREPNGEMAAAHPFSSG
jgi:hypothetical protein